MNEYVVIDDFFEIKVTILGTCRERNFLQLGRYSVYCMFYHGLRGGPSIFIFDRH